ncbi:MAG: hypothetical protein H7836_14035 [Magnetococcus sp. YQC-3]
MIELLDRIYKAILSGLKRQNFEYKFYNLNGTEENPQLKIANSISYEFINSGNSIVIINDTLKIYPKWTGIEPSRVNLAILKNETDVSVYEYRFVEIDKNLVVAGSEIQPLQNINQAFNWFQSANAAKPFNLLQVIVKQRSAA